MGVVGEDVVGVVEDTYNMVFGDVLEIVRLDAESVGRLVGAQCTKASFEIIREAGLVEIEIKTSRGVERRWVDIKGVTLVEEHVVELCDDKDCLPVATVDRLYVEGGCYYEPSVDEDAIDLWVTGMLEEHFPDLMDEYWDRGERRYKKLTEYLK
jgi:hypothetical protein